MGIFSFLKRQKTRRAEAAEADEALPQSGTDVADAPGAEEDAEAGAGTDAAPPAGPEGTVPDVVPPATAPAPESAPDPSSGSASVPVPELPPEERAAVAAPLEKKLGRTRSRFRDSFLDFFLGSKPIDAELLEELESQLIMADVGMDATTKVMASLNRQVGRSEVSDADALRGALRVQLLELLTPVEAPLEIPERDAPFVILVVGVNGSGKTTTIGKLAKQLTDGGASVMLAAGDTFRAAAVEQLKAWGERNGVPVVSQGSGADSASVIFDALQSAKARGVDVLIADTAGRLHTQAGLMDELAKVKRVLGKIDPDAPHETLIVLDGTTGQNALAQARAFHDAVGLTGMVVTKLDGTAKGGIVFAIAEDLGLPIRFIGVGERVFDLEVFEAERFVDALVAPGGGAGRGGRRLMRAATRAAGRPER